MNIFPGKAFFSPSKPKVQPLPPIDDGKEKIEAARKQTALDAKKRRGRFASILTSGRGVQDNAAGASKLG